MPRLSARRAALAAALVAGVVYANALANGFAQDDVGLIARNPAAHSIEAAWAARFRPYWPPQDGAIAGLYRPVTTLTYAVDWVVAAGRPWWFHLSNLVLHAVATALVVLVAVEWLTPLGALAAGLVFAVHPVHVEAVANVVGRAELLAGIGILAAVLAARRYRRATRALERRLWLGGVVMVLAFGLFSKEHAVVTIAVIALDHWLTGDRWGREAVALYVAVGTVSLAWFWVWRAVAGPYAGPAEAAVFRGLDWRQRLATAVPVQWDVLRLLAWPFSLSSGYDPQVIPQRLAWGWLASGAVVVGVAILALGAGLARRAPAVAFGVLAGAVSITPTSNLVLASGVALAERTLYLATIAPAFVVGWLVVRTWDTRVRRATGAGLVLLLVAFAVQTFTRTPFWRDTRTVMINDYLEHPEDYRAHIRVARSFEELKQVSTAEREYLWAWELFPADANVADHLVRVARETGDVRLALWAAKRGLAVEPTNTVLASLLADVYVMAGERDSAIGLMRRVLERAPLHPRPTAKYLELLRDSNAPGWVLALAAARNAVAHGHWVAATQAFGSAMRQVEPPLAGLCWEAHNLGALMAQLNPAARQQLGRVSASQGCLDSIVTR